jgi:hypothetical protein
MRKIWITLFMTLPCLLAYGDGSNCKEVSGGIVTNFLTESGTVSFPGESGKQFIYTTLGTLPAISQEHSVSTSSASHREVMVSSQKCTIIG